MFLSDLGLLFLRLLTGGMLLLGHGWGKATDFSHLLTVFPDPLGFGGTLSLVLVVFAEVVCSALVMIGLATRFACAPIIFTMLVAATIVHSTDSWDKKEFALLYAIPFICLILTGPGLFSLDALIKNSKKAIRP